METCLTVKNLQYHSWALMVMVQEQIKCLVFEGDGYCLLYKRLVPGFRYQWPQTAQEVKELTPEQFLELMKGFNPLQKGLIGEVRPERVG